MTISPAIIERFKAFRANHSFAHMALKFAKDESKSRPTYYSAAHIVARQIDDKESATLLTIYNPHNMGFRSVGYSDEIITQLDHNGWYADAFDDETYRGQVFRISGKNGKQRLVYGYYEKNTGYHIINMTDITTTLSDCDDYDAYAAIRQVAREADAMAQKAANLSKEEDTCYSIGESIVDLIVENNTLKAANEKTRRELKTMRKACPNFDRQVPNTIAALSEVMRENNAKRKANRSKIAEYKRGNYRETYIYMDSHYAAIVNDTIRTRFA